MKFRCKWVGRYSPDEKQFRFFRVMWETMEDHTVSHKVSVSIKKYLPRITWRKSYGGVYV